MDEAGCTDALALGSSDLSDSTPTNRRQPFALDGQVLVPLVAGIVLVEITVRLRRFSASGTD